MRTLILLVLCCQEGIASPLDPRVTALSARSLGPLLRATKNWQTARYRATAIHPASTSLTELLPCTSKGAAPIMNTKGERSPRTTEITILPIDATTLRFQISRAQIAFSMQLLAFGDEPACATPFQHRLRSCYRFLSAGFIRLLVLRSAVRVDKQACRRVARGQAAGLALKRLSEQYWAKT